MLKFKAYKNIGEVDQEGKQQSAKIDVYYYADTKTIYCYINNVTLERKTMLDGTPYTIETFLVFADKAMKFKLETLTRKNDKRLAAWGAAIMAKKEEIFDQYLAGNKEIVASIIFNIKL